MKRPCLLTATSWLLAVAGAALSCGGQPLTRALACAVAAWLVLRVRSLNRLEAS